VTATAQNTGQRDTVVRVNPAELAPHPANPRKDLGDLTDLIASITAHGVLEPVIVVPADTVAQAWPDHADQLQDNDAQYVTLLGHRRVAAAQAAMLDELTVVVRDDLTTAAAHLSAMTAENVARANLTPLEEATAFQALAAQGWPQRRIAGELGCAQSHVSKRLKLLALPGELQDAVGAGELDITDALKLGTLPDHDSVTAAWHQLREERGDAFGDDFDVDYIVQSQRRELEQAAKRKAALEKAATEGIEVVDPGKRFGPRSWSHSLHDKRSIDSARKKGELVYAIGHGGDLVPYTTSTPKEAEERSQREQDQAVEQRERRHATKAREQSCPRLVADLPDLDRLRDLLARAVLERNVPDANALKLAARWLETAGIGPTSRDSYKWAAAMAHHDDAKLRAHAAWAGLVASWELHARASYITWGRREVAYLDLLQTHGYQPTPWEQAQLDAARANGTDQSSGCTNLACTLPGWHDGQCNLNDEEPDDSEESTDSEAGPTSNMEAQ
jgi:ParB family chromosome partitioning protein